MRKAKLWRENCRWPMKGKRVLQLPCLCPPCLLCAQCLAEGFVLPKACSQDLFFIHASALQMLYNHFSYCLLLSLWYLVKKG